MRSYAGHRTVGRTMADTQTNSLPLELVAKEYLSSLDVVLVTVITGLLVYWFIFRKKAEDVPEFKKLSTEEPSSSRETSFIEKMKKTNRNVVVFYGSQTGTAEEFSNRLSKDARRYGMRGMAADPEEYDLSELSRLSEMENSLAIFCMATYGEGDPTDNAQEFFDWLQETSDSLDGVNFAVFALGNKTYEHYNAMGKFVDKRLAELGARRIFDLGMGDDDGNLEEDFVSWQEQFWPAVCEHFGVEATGEDCSIRQYELVVHNDIDKNKVYTGELARLKSFETQKPPFDSKNPFLARVTTNRKLNKGGSRHLMHLELDIADSKIRYDSGDHIAVYPMNEPSIVNKMGEILGTDLDTVFSLNNLDEESNKKHPFPCPTTYRTALTHYLDITNPPRTNVLYEMAQYATDPKDQENLRKMASSSSEGKALYHSWVQESRRNILAILEDMPSLRPPIDHLCELLPRLQARYYSIASSAKVHPDSIHICAVVVEYETKTGRTHKGVATNWLKNKVVNDNGHKPSVPMYVRKSQFRLPFKASNPIIMIGPGTGIAPFMGFIQERAWLKQQGNEVGETVLYYGCRHQNEDFLYQEELEEYERTGVLTQLNVAFSRDQNHKVYVQHLLKRNKEHLWNLINSQNAHIYVCGDARNMARDVQNAFYEIVEELGDMTHFQAVDYIKKLMTKGRYSQDVWS
ncbi:NADPH-cytochrome P450 reductase isoform X1 [Arapaima gigas]